MMNRRGVSLVELLVVMSVLSVVLSGVAVAFSTMTRLERRIHDEFTASDVLDRLAARFREDAYRSRIAEASADGKAVVFGGVKGSEITYTAVGKSVSRSVRDGGRIRHRETFEWPTEFEATWSVAASRLITLTTRRRVEHRASGLDMFRVAEVVAAVKE